MASFFVSRVDTEIDRRLEESGADPALRGRAGVANARLAYRAFEEFFAGERWESLAADGARPQRPLWASTGVKNPEYRDTMYVTDLVVAGTVNTMPEKTLEAFADHGEVRGDQVTPHLAEAEATMAALAEAGIDYDDVIAVLEREGVEKFVTSWQELLETVDGQLAQAGPTMSAVTGDAQVTVDAGAGPPGGLRRGDRRPGRRPRGQQAGRERSRAVGPGRRGGGRQAARLGRPGRAPPARWCRR